MTKSHKNLNDRMTNCSSDRIVLRSHRLYLRELSAQDLDFLAKLHRDRSVMQHIGPLRTRKQVHCRLNSIIENYANRPDFGIWMCCLNDTDQPIGWACLKDLDGTDEVEIGYRLASENWGKGYATEISKALLLFGFERHLLQAIVAVTRPENEASKRVLEKCGLRYQHMAIYYNSEVFYYKINRDQWQESEETATRSNNIKKRSGS